MANRWGNSGNSGWLYFFWSSKITADGDCRHEIKRRLLLGIQVMANLDSILKSRDFADKDPSSESYGFSSSYIWMWELNYRESWDWRIDAFELWCWRRLLKVHWTARRSNQSILKEISPECSLEGLMLKLKLQYCGHLMRTDSCEKTLILGKIEGGRRRRQQRVRWLDGISSSMDMSLNELQKMVMDREARHAVVHGVAKSRLSNWTELNCDDSEGPPLHSSRASCGVSWVSVTPASRLSLPLPNSASLHLVQDCSLVSFSS